MPKVVNIAVKATATIRQPCAPSIGAGAAGLVTPRR